MNCKERQERRKVIAEKILAGSSIKEICQELSVSTSLVRESCREHGVSATGANGKRARSNLAPRTYEILAILLNTDTGTREIAEEIGISRSRVYEILTKAREAGIQFPHRKTYQKEEGQTS